MPSAPSGFRHYISYCSWYVLRNAKRQRISFTKRFIIRMKPSHIYNNNLLKVQLHDFKKFSDFVILKGFRCHESCHCTIQTDHMLVSIWHENMQLKHDCHIIISEQRTFQYKNVTIHGYKNCFLKYEW